MPLGHNKKPSKCISNVRVSRKSVRQTNTEPPTAVKLLAKSESDTKTSKESKSKPKSKHRNCRLQSGTNSSLGSTRAVSHPQETKATDGTESKKSKSTEYHKRVNGDHKRVCGKTTTETTDAQTQQSEPRRESPRQHDAGGPDHKVENNAQSDETVTPQSTKL